MFMLWSGQLLPVLDVLNLHCPYQLDLPVSVLVGVILELHGCTGSTY
jgi:hypothetical protein